MLLFALACRHASPPDPAVTAQHESPEVAVGVCDSDSVTHDLQKRLGPQRCASDSDCTSHDLWELVPMMPPDARERLGNVGVPPDPMVYTTSLLLGPETTLTSLVEPAVELVRACTPRPRFAGAVGTDGVVILRSARPAESAQFVGADGMVREQCIAEFAAPACTHSACVWRPQTRVVPCSRASADSSM
jgi:hypothetical protein